MAHMQPDITEKQNGWQIETMAGTEFLPGDVQSIPEWLKPGVTVECDSVVFDLLAPLLRDYVEGDIVSIEAISAVYFARLSAPGYLDCTQWCAFRTRRAACDYLRDL